MKKLTFLLTALSLMAFSSTTFAGSCNFPDALKVGVKIGSDWGRGTVTEIDKKSCWMKIDNSTWLNLNAVAGFIILEE